MSACNNKIPASISVHGWYYIAYSKVSFNVRNVRTIIIFSFHCRQWSINVVDINTISNLAIYVIKPQNDDIKSTIVTGASFGYQIVENSINKTFEMNIVEYSIDMHTGIPMGKLNVACIRCEKFFNTGT